MYIVARVNLRALTAVLLNIFLNITAKLVHLNFVRYVIATSHT